MNKIIDRKKSREGDSGAALETIISQRLIEHKHITPTNRCIRKQKTDEAAINRIDVSLKEQFENAANKIVEFIEEKLINEEEYEIDRTNDNDESVEDIVLQSKSKKINFSIKHNNDSIKHNRPFSLISNGLGFQKNSVEDIDHRKRLMHVCDQFRKNFPSATKFSDLTMKAKEDLYYQLMNECRNSLLKYNKFPDAVESLFNFIMGKDYIKIKVETFRKKNNFKILYEDFRDEAIKPKSFVVTKTWKGERKGNACASWNFEIVFDNGYKFTHRIHNGSSRISQKYNTQLAMKFDVKFAKDSVKGKVI